MSSAYPAGGGPPASGGREPPDSCTRSAAGLRNQGADAPRSPAPPVAPHGLGATGGAGGGAGTSIWTSSPTTRTAKQRVLTRGASAQAPSLRRNRHACHGQVTTPSLT